MNRSQVTDGAVRAFARHPYLWALGICLAIDPLFMGSMGNIPNNALLIEFLLVLAGIGVVCFAAFRSGRLTKARALIVFLLLAGAEVMGTKQYNASQTKDNWHFIGGCALILAVYAFVRSDKYREQLNSLMIIGFGFMLKLNYILVTSCYSRQNDVRTFDGNNGGHAGYIDFLLYNHKLPDTDVRDTWQFCHPPLHHFISAVWIHFNENIFHVGHDQARESLQTLSLFYAMCMVISGYKILRHFKLKGAALYAPLLLISFHPSMILFSGAINNDPLSAVFIMGAMVSLLKWTREPTIPNILKIALCVGLGMMTKISAAIVAPPIAIIFLIELIRRRKEWKAVFTQYVCFGLVCVPLGLWFGIRNYLKWGVPLVYVQAMSKNELQYLGDRTLIQRIADFKLSNFSNVFENWAWRDEAGAVQGFNEYDPLTAILKNSMFGESINSGTFDESIYAVRMAQVLFWVNVVSAAAAFICIIAVCLTKTRSSRVEKTFMLSFYVILMAQFYKTCADYPFTCTMNFRYLTPTVFIGAWAAGLMIDRYKEKPVVARASVAVSILFACCVGVFYILL